MFCGILVANAGPGKEGPPLESKYHPQYKLGRPQLPMTDNLKGILLMLASTVAFIGMHTMIKDLATDMHPFEIAFFRNFFGLIFITPMILRHGLAPMKTKRLGLHSARAGLNVVSMLCFFMALSLAPLTDVTALTFSAPIFGTVLAVVFLKEVVGVRRWVAIGVGFAGTLVVLRPGFVDVGTGQLLALIAALLWGCALIIIKNLTRTESSLTITFYMMVLVAPLSLIPAMFFWTWPTTDQYIYLGILAVFGTTGHLLMNQALKFAEANVVLPIDFVRLIWVSIIGYFIFGEIPEFFTYLGGAMIFASGIYIAYRERTKGTTS